MSNSTPALSTLKPNELSHAEVQNAKRFSEQHGSMTVSQCCKYLQYIFALKRGQIDLERFKRATGYDGSAFVEQK